VLDRLVARDLRPGDGPATDAKLIVLFFWRVSLQMWMKPSLAPVANVLVFFRSRMFQTGS